MVGTWKKFVSETWLILARTLKKVAHPWVTLAQLWRSDVFMNLYFGWEGLPHSERELM